MPGSTSAKLMIVPGEAGVGDGGPDSSVALVSAFMRGSDVGWMFVEVEVEVEDLEMRWA